MILCVWFGGWIFAETSVGSEISKGFNSGPALFMVFWFAGWTVGGFFALRTLIWNLFGKEIITVGMGALTIDKKGAIFYRSKTYDLREAKNFRAQEESYVRNSFGSRSQGNIFNLDKTGTIKFDYGMQTIKFGDSLDEAEANYIFQKLRDKKYLV